MLNLILKSDGLVKIILSKWLSKLLKRYLGKDAQVSIHELSTAGEDDTLTVKISGELTISKERLLQLLEKKVDTL